MFYSTMRRKILKIIFIVFLFLTAASLSLTGYFIYSSQKDITNAKFGSNIIYFTPGADESEILMYREKLIKELNLSTESIQYMSAEQVLENFKERHKDDGLTLQALGELGENPLRAQISISVDTKSMYSNVIENLNQDVLPEYVSKVSFVENSLQFVSFKAYVKALRIDLYITDFVLGLLALLFGILFLTSRKVPAE